MAARILAAAVLLAAAAAPAGEPRTEDFPKAHAAMRLQLHEAGDAALQAQARHFPEHYDALVAHLVALRRQAEVPQASMALARLSQAHWQRYNALVRQGRPEDWRELVRARRELFALIAVHDRADLCLAYEYQGTMALATHANPAYRAPTGAYVARFIAAAAQARAAPQHWDDVGAADLALLHDTMRAGGAEPELLHALRPGGAVHTRFCEAMIAALDAALALEGMPAARLWRFLVTAPPAAAPADRGATIDQ